jgi:hypothetical protein
MFALLHSLVMFVIDFFKSPRRLEAENLFLRHQLSIALRRAPSRLRLRGEADMPRALGAGQSDENDPNVWSGRALQENCFELADAGKWLRQLALNDHAT